MWLRIVYTSISLPPSAFIKIYSLHYGLNTESSYWAKSTHFFKQEKFQKNDIKSFVFNQRGNFDKIATCKNGAMENLIVKKLRIKKPSFTLEQDNRNDALSASLEQARLHPLKSQNCIAGRLGTMLQSDYGLGNLFFVIGFIMAAFQALDPDRQAKRKAGFSSGWWQILVLSTWCWL